LPLHSDISAMPQFLLGLPTFPSISKGAFAIAMLVSCACR